MAKITRCDNDSCRKEFTEHDTSWELSQVGLARTIGEMAGFGDDPKQFCSIKCVAGFATEAWSKGV